MTSPAQPGGRRVLHVLRYYRPVLTGEGALLERSSAVMQELAPDTTHDLLVTHSPRPAAEGAACTTLRRVVHLSEGRLRLASRQVALSWWLLRNLHRYDTVHFHAHADWSFTSALLTRLAGRRLVLSAALGDSVPELVSQYRPRLRALAARAFGLVSAHVSAGPDPLARTQTVLARERCHLVPPGIPALSEKGQGRASLRQALGFGPADPVLLFLGSLSHRKDPLSLVLAMPAILEEQPGARLVLAGPAPDPAYAAAIRQAVRQSGLESHVVLAGEQKDPRPYFEAADMLVLSSRMERLGSVVLEAMAHGLPVVARRLPGAIETLVRDGETGLLFETPDSYVEAVLRLLGDPGLRQRLGARGREVATNEFGMQGIARQQLEIYGSGQPLPLPAETGLGFSASITDRRFHSAYEPPAGGQPLLISMVDAEEAFDWSRPFDRNARDVSSMSAQALAHRVFERHGVKPLYLVDHPVATDDAGRGPLREFLRGGLCEIGAQMHPWVTPPFTEEVGERNSYAGNLPVALELAKARCLTNVLGDAFGEAPLIYRTGRFGAGPRTADILKRLGYLADSSVTPFWPAEGVAGSFAASAKPYWADRERTLLEIPVSAALVGRLADGAAGRIAPLLFDDWAERFRIAGAMSHLGLLERIRLSPEGMTIEEARRLVRHMLARGHRVFVLTYHSPSLVPGNTPYVRDLAQRDRFLAWLDEFYTFFREEVGGRTGSWRDVRLGQVAAARSPVMVP